MDESQLEVAYQAVVVGVSAGGLSALSILVSGLPADFQLPLIVVQHLSADSGDFLSKHLDARSALCVKEAEDKEALAPTTIYIAPAGYHLLIETERVFSLSVDPPVNYSRPSIDVLFESAAYVYGDKLVGIVLTGANSDGSQGLKEISDRRGMTIVQDPSTAEVPSMPLAALAAVNVDQVLSLEAMVHFLGGLNHQATGQDGRGSRKGQGRSAR